MAMDRLLIIRGGAVGDFIVTLPVIGALRQTFPQAWIEVLGHASRICLADHPRYADRVMDVEHVDMYRLFHADATVSSRLATYLRSFDLIVAYVPTADGVFNQQLARYCPGQVITWPPHPPAGVHVTDYLLQALETLPLRYADPCPRVEIPIRADVTAETFWQTAGHPAAGVVAFHPGSGSRQKLWPLDGWGEVMSWAGRHGLGGIVIQGPAEHERGLQKSLRERGIPDWPWTGDLSLHELAALLKRCQVVVSHDSGIAHLAAAVGATTLALFGPTDPHVWGPRSPRACVLQPAAAQPLTLDNLPPDVVIQTLEALLEGTFAWQTASIPCTVRRLENV